MEFLRKFAEQEPITVQANARVMLDQVIAGSIRCLCRT